MASDEGNKKFKFCFLSWFISRKCLVKELENSKKLLFEARRDIEILESNLEESKKKSDIMDLLGDEELFKRLTDYGSLESILKRVSDYERLNNAYKTLETQIKKLKSLVSSRKMDINFGNGNKI
ncbi:hypothetical protein [Candidatus Mycoplasma haematohominis]|uniref:Uncharacterized protein n=1 Tax=Candidatus Mycoplasma haematohominis TaxID=1494318 RepID=A0A478FV68_9MOLU|nr:hypothetical protein [Candidatus Mycoplasma haemohominis]GCE64025.1 hypothetical protein MHSWG343_10330 [Candidatus Mycoplasma haemohominis]